MTVAEMQAKINELEAQTKELKKTKNSAIYLKASQKGCVSIYGLQRMPFSFYVGQLENLFKHFSTTMPDDLVNWIKDNANDLKWQTDEQRSKYE